MYGLVASTRDGYHFEIDEGLILLINKSAFHAYEWEEVHILILDMQNWSSNPNYFRNYLDKAVKLGLLTKELENKIVSNTQFISVIDVLNKAGIKYP